MPKKKTIIPRSSTMANGRASSGVSSRTQHDLNMKAKASWRLSHPLKKL